MQINLTFGDEIKIDGEDYLVISMSDVIAVIE